MIFNVYNANKLLGIVNEPDLPKARIAAKKTFGLPWLWVVKMSDDPERRKPTKRPRSTADPQERERRRRLRSAARECERRRQLRAIGVPTETLH